MYGISDSGSDPSKNNATDSSSVDDSTQNFVGNTNKIITETNVTSYHFQTLSKIVQEMLEESKDPANVNAADYLLETEHLTTTQRLHSHWSVFVFYFFIFFFYVFFIFYVFYVFVKIFQKKDKKKISHSTIKNTHKKKTK